MDLPPQFLYEMFPTIGNNGYWLIFLSIFGSGRIRWFPIVQGDTAWRSCMSEALDPAIPPISEVTPPADSISDQVASCSPTAAAIPFSPTRIVKSMRLICLSDTHGEQDRFKVPDGDILIHAGDFCSMGTEREVHKVATWLKRLPHRWKIVVAGNHDRFFEQQPELARAYLEPEILYLQDSGCQIEGLRFWGAPWQPWFCDWAFNLPRRGERLRKKWNLIPLDTDVLITHGPPHGVLDEVRARMTAWGPSEDGSGPLGCEELAIRLATVKPRLHVFGHIHDGYGFIEKGDTTHVNASVCDEDYRPVNPVWVVDVEPGKRPVVRATPPGKRKQRKIERNSCGE